MRGNAKRRAARSDDAPASGFLSGLTDLLEKLSDLAETGRELHKSGEFGDDKLKAVYGLRVKFGSSGNAVDVEPFGNVKIDKKLRRPIVQEVREPLVDVIEESDHVLVVAEMPGVSAGDVSVSVDHDVMTIEAVHKEKKYRKEVLLPKPVSGEGIALSCNNGIVEIKCRLK